MKEITQIEAEKKYKIFTRHHEMDNGEFRFRLLRDDGTGCAITEAGGDGFWQESHCHKSVKETYIIQKGWVACAKLQNEKCKIQIFKEDEIFTIEPEVAHNLYLSKGAVIYTIKHGVSKKDNRVVNSEAKKLDNIVQGLGEEQILVLAENSRIKIV